MKIKVDIDVVPFDIPEDVMVKSGPFGPKTLPLKELTSEALNSLCKDFRQEVFKKAGKIDPESMNTRPK